MGVSPCLTEPFVSNELFLTVMIQVHTPPTLILSSYIFCILLVTKGQPWTTL